MTQRKQEGKSGNKRVIKHKGTFYTFNYLLSAAYNALATAREHKTGAAYQFLSVVLFSAFAIEAHLNHIGERKVKSWDKIERSLSPHQKLALIAEILNFEIDRSRQPFQSFPEIFAFRNYFAHGRTKYIDDTFTDSLPRESPVPSLGPKEIQQLEERHVSRLLEDARSMILAVHKAAGFSEHQIGLISSGRSSIQ